MSLRFRTPEKVAAIPDPMTNSGRWDAIFPPLGGYSPIVEDCSIPIPNVSTEQVPVGSRMRNLPGYQESMTFTTTFYVDVSMNIYEYLDTWKQLIHNRSTQSYGYPDDYCKKITFYLYGLSGVVPVRKYELINCFPTKTAPIELKSTEKPDRLRCVQTFSVDNVVPQQILLGALATNLLGGNIMNTVIDQGISGIIGSGAAEKALEWTSGKVSSFLPQKTTQLI